MRIRILIFLMGLMAMSACGTITQKRTDDAQERRMEQMLMRGGR